MNKDKNGHYLVDIFSMHILLEGKKFKLFRKVWELFMKKVRILFINGGLMDRGGISSFLINYISTFDLSKFDIMLAVHGYEKGQRDFEIKKLGIPIINLPIKNKHPLEWRKTLLNLFKKKQFDIVHANCDAGNGPILHLARKAGVKTRISHSHNIDHLTRNKFRIFVNEVQKKMIIKNATDFFACSSDAGIWLYGNSSPFKVIPNAIDYSKYEYNKNDRETVREDLGCMDDSILVGHVGRFDFQKNQEFIVDIAYKFRNVPKMIFILIGTGKDKKFIVEKIKSLQLNNIKLLGERSDVNKLLNAFDVFILPSRFEGLGISAIEAQVNGLQCILSDKIPRETNISNNSIYLPLNNVDKWVQELQKVSVRDTLKQKNCVSKHYDLFSNSVILQEFLLDKVE